MAEIGLVASVVTLAAAGTSIATSLYQAADVITHANEQIYALAKHVTQFTAVLKHMAQVLKEERNNCSREVLRDIRKIKHSCKRTFKEIESTLKSQRFRHFGPVRWIFKRTKALELQARLDSQQSMLQCIIHTLTVSKLGHMDSRSKQDSEHISGLRTEINLLKTFIMESYRNLTELKRAEDSAAAESMYSGPSPDDPMPPPSTSNSEDEGKSSSDDESNESDDDNTNHDDGDDSDLRSRHLDFVPKPTNAQHQISRLTSAPKASKHIERRESNMLLQMVPYRPRARSSLRPDRLIQDLRNPDGNVQSSGQSAIESVRLLLDKWTAAGSIPFSDILSDEIAKEGIEHTQLNEGQNPGAPFDSSPYPSPLDEYDLYGNGRPPQGPNQYGYAWQNPMNHPVLPSFSGLQQKDLWRPPNLWERYRHIGIEILHAMRSTRGGIYYAKTSTYKQVFFIDSRPIFTCFFIPEELIPEGEAYKFDTTELLDGMIRKAALDLLGYVYRDVEVGKFAVQADLEFIEIEQLVYLSFQALDRQNRILSGMTITERGWNNEVEDLRKTTNRPTALPAYPHPSSNYGHQSVPQSGVPYLYAVPPPGVNMPMPPPYFEPRSESVSGTESLPSHEDPRDKRELTERSNPEVRFTLPKTGLMSSPSEKVKRSPAKRPKAHVSPPVGSELEEAYLKLARLLIRQEEAEHVKNLDVASDLLYYAIPDLEIRIIEMEKGQKKGSDIPDDDSDEVLDMTEHMKRIEQKARDVLRRIEVSVRPSSSSDITGTFVCLHQYCDYSSKRLSDLKRHSEAKHLNKRHYLRQASGSQPEASDQKASAGPNEEASRQSGDKENSIEDKRPKEISPTLEERGRQIDERLRRLDEDEARQARLKGYRQKRTAAATGTRNSTKKKPQQARVESEERPEK